MSDTPLSARGVSVPEAVEAAAERAVRHRTGTQRHYILTGIASFLAELEQREVDDTYARRAINEIRGAWIDLREAEYSS